MQRMKNWCEYSGLRRPMKEAVNVGREEKNYSEVF
jgi:hypothetical protein